MIKKKSQTVWGSDPSYIQQKQQMEILAPSPPKLDMLDYFWNTILHQI